jgi:hypothetical protein
MTRHYSVAQIDELVAALEVIADEPGRANKTRQMLQLEGGGGSEVPKKSLTPRKKGLDPIDLTLWFVWRARQDSNPRPPGS